MKHKKELLTNSPTTPRPCTSASPSSGHRQKYTHQVPAGIHSRQVPDVYVHDWVFDRRDKSCTKPRVIAKILQHKIKMGRTEANNGDDEYSDDVYRILRSEHNYSINMSHKKAPTNMAKLTRIEQYAPDIRRFYFRSDACRDEDYRRAMSELTGFSFTTKNLHDDAPDSLAMLADYLTSGIKTVSVGKRPF